MTSSQPSRITKAQKRVSVSQTWWAVRQDGTQSKVRYMYVVCRRQQAERHPTDSSTALALLQMTRALIGLHPLRLAN